MRRPRCSAVTSGWLVVLAGCGTILNGTHQSVNVQSSPRGATLQVAPDTGTFTTPATLNLERKHSYVLTFTSPGYTPATLALKPDIALGTAFADGFFTGFVGAAVDAITGGLYGLKPESPTVTLTRVTGSSGPLEIHVRVDPRKDGRQVALRADEPSNVIVRVVRR